MKLRVNFLPTALLAVMVLLAGCEDPLKSGLGVGSSSGRRSLSSVGKDGALSPFPELADTIKSVVIDLPATPPAHEASDEALVAAVREVGGSVYIGFKPPSARHTRETGIIPAMSRAQALEGRKSVQSLGAKIVQTYRASSMVVAEIPAELAPEIRKLPIVNYIEPAATARLFHSYPAQDTSWGVRKVRAPEVWQSLVSGGGYNLGQGANITIIDTGVDYDHVADWNGDGPAAMHAVNCLYTPSNPAITGCFDDAGHGRHVSGIVAARSNAYGYIGVAHNPPSVSSVKACDYQGNCVLRDIISALDWTTTNGLPRQIVNLSNGTDVGTTGFSEAVARSYNAGNLLVAAAGNSPPLSAVAYPAAYSQVIAVSGTLEDDSFASSYYCQRTFGLSGTGGSVSGPEVEISAPYWAYSMVRHMDYDRDCGTSMAAPVVTGVAALVWTKHPTWSNAAVRVRLQQGVVDLGPPGRDVYFGYGRIDATLAVNRLIVSISGPGLIESAGTYTWQATPEGGDGTYTYAWESSPNGSTWTPVGSSQSYSRYVGMNDSQFRLRVHVTSGWQSTSAGKVVNVSTCGSGGLCF